MSRIFKNIGPYVGLVIFLIAIGVLHRSLASYRYHDLLAALRALPAGSIIAAFGLTLLNYAVLTGYDALAFRYVGHSLPYHKIAFASFIGYAFSNNIGLSLLAGSAVRYRLYSSWGVSTIEITKMVVFYTLTLWVGILALGGTVFITVQAALPGLADFPPGSICVLGCIFLLLLTAYFIGFVLRKRSITVYGHEITMPSPSLSLAQIVIACFDWLLAGLVLYVLLPPHEASFLTFLAIYLLAQIASLVSQVPGGLGVFESVVVLLSSMMPAPGVIGGLLVYRAVYYLFPLAIAASMLGGYEIFRARSHAVLVLRFLGQAVPVIVPRVLSVMTFLTGAILLFSGATPAVSARLLMLMEVLPLPLLEVSHFLGSLIGASLLLLAWGIRRRLNVAYHATIIMLAAGALSSLVKGLDYEESIILLVMLGTLLFSRKFFYRPASLLEERLSPNWIAATIGVIGGSIWLGLFAFRHVEYTNELWWQFTLDGEAPRFLRASVGAITLAVLAGIARLLRPAPPEPVVPTAGDVERARAVIDTSPDTTAFLSLLGDKQLLFSRSSRSFLMYGVEGRSWVAMGDPVGAPDERRELVWLFRELCDRHDGWPVFYEACAENLPLYLELGLSPLKIGEEARVPLADFSLEGSRRKGLRYAHSRTAREGAVFSVVMPADLPALLPELRAISDAWLADKNTREKRFSLGSFSESYISSLPVAIVQYGGIIVAFANIWAVGSGEELSIDLMRYRSGAPRGVMEYLFVELMLWGKERRYRWFNLGMVPLAGLEDRSLAPLWNRLGARVFRHGEHFYNFQGLRQFKEHFDPQWSPKYLISPGGFALPRILVNLATLISGSLKGAISK